MWGFYKYFDYGFGFDKLKNLIDEYRVDLSKEYEKFFKSDKLKFLVCEYFCSEVECCVRDCFVGFFYGDVDIFFIKKDESGMLSIF